MINPDDTSHADRPLRAEFPTQRPRYEDKRQRILDVATVLLNERGVAGMTFQDVAQALSLKTTSIIYYFRYKELLAATVFEDSLSRLAAIVDEAAAAPTPVDRVSRYLELYFVQSARALRGESRPLAIFSEIRALEDAYKKPLIAQYQSLFRSVRAFFGESGTPERRRLLTARTQLLNEALFWSATWLPRYAIADFPNVRQRLLDILRSGIGTADHGSITAPPLAIKSRAPTARSAFLQTATRLINQNGYKGASVDRIAREMSLTKGAFYHHIDAKDDLVLECFRDTYQRLKQIQVLADERGGTQWTKLLSGITAALFLQFSAEYPLLRSTALQAMPAGLRDVALSLGNREALWLSGVLFEGMREGSVRLVDPAIAGHVIMSTINSAYDIRTWAASQSIDDAVSNYAGLLSTGIFAD